MKQIGRINRTKTAPEHSHPNIYCVSRNVYLNGTRVRIQRKKYCGERTVRRQGGRCIADVDGGTSLILRFRFFEKKKYSVPVLQRRITTLRFHVWFLKIKKNQKRWFLFPFRKVPVSNGSCTVKKHKKSRSGTVAATGANRIVSCGYFRIE